MKGRNNTTIVQISLSLFAKRLLNISIKAINGKITMAMLKNIQKSNPREGEIKSMVVVLK